MNDKDPLHDVTLEVILVKLVEKYGWDAMADKVPVKCFYNNPSIRSSLTFLRKTPWARKRVEDFYIQSL